MFSHNTRAILVSSREKSMKLFCWPDHESSWINVECLRKTSCKDNPVPTEFGSNNLFDRCEKWYSESTFHICYARAWSRYLREVNAETCMDHDIRTLNPPAEVSVIKWTKAVSWWTVRGKNKAIILFLRSKLRMIYE